MRAQNATAFVQINTLFGAFMKYRLGLVTALVATLTACVTPVAVPDNTGSDAIITVPAPIIIGKQPDIIIIDKQGKPQENSVHVCTLSAFTSTYKAEDINRGKAMLNVKKQCLAKNHEMFCKDQDIKCKEYK